MMKTAILLATYNSSKYIKEQLDSLYRQTERNWTIYVHDDGSSDDTLEIIQEYEDKYGNIKVIGKEVKHLGPKKNFMYLLENVDADYYLFCDHDDVWLEDKIKVSIEQIKANEGSTHSIPVVFHSDLIVVDGSLNIKGNSLWSYAKILPEVMHKRNYVLTSCYITGCTLAINKAAKYRLAPMPDNAIMHDWWIGVQAVLQNMVIISYPKPTILYRLHGNNDSGIPRIKAWPYLKKIFQSFFVSTYDRQVKPFSKEFGLKHYTFYKGMLILRKLFHRFK